MVKIVDVAVAAIPRRRLDLPPTGSGAASGCYDLLITKRLTNAVYGDYWELPGGKIEPGETPETAAERECLEELGVRVRVVRVLEPIVHTYDHATVRLHTCVARIEPGSGEPQNLHVAAHRWCALDSLPWECFLPANVRVVTALLRYLESGDFER